MEAIEKYIIDNSTPQDELLAELERETFRRAVHPHMISGHMQGRLLELIVRMINPESILEIGTFTGYATLSMAAGLSGNSTIDTIEADDEIGEISAPFFERSPHRSKIITHTGSALTVAPWLGKTFDLVFIDGGKKEYPAYYRMLMGDGEFSGSGPLVRSGSFILADNILWYGKVADPAQKDADTMAIAEFNRLVANDPRMENIILPLRDGINIVRVK